MHDALREASGALSPTEAGEGCGAFAAEVAAFVNDCWPPTARRRRSRAALHYWRAGLAERGWCAPAWPAAVGGAGWSLAQRAVWERALALAEAPRLAPFGLGCVGPLLYTYGDPSLCSEHLDGIRSGRTRWADGLQGLSPPDRRLSCRPHGAGYRLNGCLTGIVGLDGLLEAGGVGPGPGATHLACLTEVDQAGPAAVPVDVNEAGVEALGAGEAGRAGAVVLVDVNEAGVERVDGRTVAFTDVEAALLGAPGQAKEMLQFALQGPHAPVAPTAAAQGQLARLRRALDEAGDGCGGRLADQPSFRRRLADLETELLALQAVEARSLPRRAMGASAGADILTLRLRCPQLRRRIDAACADAAGYYALPLQDTALLDNEPALAPSYALPAGQGMLDACSLVDRPWAEDAVRRRLSAWLAGGGGSDIGL